MHQVHYTTFCRLWKELAPQIVVMKPMTDLCWTCQKNSAAVIKASNCNDERKFQVLQVAINHITLAEKERARYNAIYQLCRSSVRSAFANSFPLPFTNVDPSSVAVEAHYSFDMAQQVHYPSNPLQPGPIYFLTPRKCTVFGVRCEAISRQVFYLTDEAADCGKGANSIVSRLHHFFEHHGLGEKNVYLHADNCKGQNKNNIRMWDMSDCTCMASGDRRFLGNFFDLNFISITFERKSKVLEVFLDISLVR